MIELLVVISIIALLLAILMPSLSKVKQKASGVVCMNNTKNLSLGWFMYQEDNNGRIVGATSDATESDGTYVGWAGAPRDENGTILSITQRTPAVTDEDEMGISYKQVDKELTTGILSPQVKEMIKHSKHKKKIPEVCKIK